ncbi:rhomboid family intramembrane serine protease [Cerasicoccus frondis]|uniref:rhomboid family intramembrane serine protease n=1 Tax=Cerasicoccus frondis TaxID=490090 RepID=UPI002852B616|nr:rhomboid family intramembrane serine protease [Cerasicoccus frondis]
MLYDRPYMRNRAPVRHVDYFWWSFWIFVGAFIVQNILGVWFRAGPFLFDWVALSVNNILGGKVWTVFTYSLMHGGLQHFLFNGIAFFFVGRWISREIEPKRYLHLLLGSIFMGGLVWLTVHALIGPEQLYAQPVIGFSAAVAGLLVATCLMWPHGQITLLLFFVLPVSFKPRTLLWILVGIDAAGFVFVELASLLGFQPIMRDGGVAFSAHLGGALAGFLFYRMLQRPTPLFETVAKKVSVEPPKWTKKRTPASTGKFKVNLTNHKDLRRELDRILDKISRDGFESLSEEEKKVLNDAGDLLKK